MEEVSFHTLFFQGSSGSIRVLITGAAEKQKQITKKEEAPAYFEFAPFSVLQCNCCGSVQIFFTLFV